MSKNALQKRLKQCSATVRTVTEMDKTPEDLDDVLIKALANPERKNILRIVGSYSEGVCYTGILEESGLSTGRSRASSASRPARKSPRSAVW